MFNPKLIKIKRMFSKMQNSTSLDIVRFLREQLRKFCHKNLHLFSDLETMLFTYEALSECKNGHKCTRSIASVPKCPLTMIMRSPSVCLSVGMQKGKRRANDGMVRNRVITQSGAEIYG